MLLLEDIANWKTYNAKELNELAKFAYNTYAYNLNIYPMQQWFVKQSIWIRFPTNYDFYKDFISPSDIIINGHKVPFRAFLKRFINYSVIVCRTYQYHLWDKQNPILSKDVLRLIAQMLIDSKTTQAAK